MKSNTELDKSQIFIFEMEKEYTLRCPVCGKYTFASLDDKEACHICGWKNDQYQFEHPDSADGINGISLKEYKCKFIEWMHI